MVTLILYLHKQNSFTNENKTTPDQPYGDDDRNIMRYKKS